MEKAIFAKRLVELMVERGESDSYIAKKTEISPSSLTKYKTGNIEIKSHNLCSLAEHFGVTTDYLLGRSDHRYPADSNLQIAAETTGLSDKAVAKLNGIKNLSVGDDDWYGSTLYQEISDLHLQDKRKMPLQFLSSIIENKALMDVLLVFYEYYITDQCYIKRRLTDEIYNRIKDYLKLEPISSVDQVLDNDFGAVEFQTNSCDIEMSDDEIIEAFHSESMQVKSALEENFRKCLYNFIDKSILWVGPTNAISEYIFRHGGMKTIAAEKIAAILRKTSEQIASTEADEYISDANNLLDTLWNSGILVQSMHESELWPTYDCAENNDAVTTPPSRVSDEKLMEAIFAEENEHIPFVRGELYTDVKEKISDELPTILKDLFVEVFQGG